MGSIRATMGTLGPVWARATPLQPRTGPIRACPWLAHSKVSLVRAQSEPAFGPVWALAGHAGHARAKPVWAPAGAAIWEPATPLKPKGNYQEKFD